MTEKRFTVESDDSDVWDRNHFIGVAYDHNNAVAFVELLNAQHERIHELEKENITIKNTIKEAMENERTHLGYNTLKQLAENLKVKIK